MADNNLVSIRQFNPVGQDERGLTSEFTLSRLQNEFVYITRKKGSISGNTYHSGKVQTTNPKTFVLLSGSIRLSYRKIDETTKYSNDINAPAVIEVLPFVTHQVEALSDFVVLECNSIKDIQEDRMREVV